MRTTRHHFLRNAVVERTKAHGEGIGLPSLNGSGKGETEEGETGAAHFIGTTGCMPSDAESTVLLDFVVALDVSGRCSASLVRSSNSSVPLVELENPLPGLRK
jgi:hypothetical protein